MRIEFGRHSGKELSEIPTSYLVWLDDQKWIKNGVRDAVQMELVSRGVESSSDDAISREYRAMFQEIARS